MSKYALYNTITDQIFDWRSNVFSRVVKTETVGLRWLSPEALVTLSLKL